MKRKPLYITLGIIALIAVVLFGMWTNEKNVSRNASTMPANISVNGLDVSCMTKKEAKRALVNHMNTEDFKLTADTSLPLYGMKYELLDALDNAVAEQGFISYIKHLTGTQYDVTIPMKIYKTTDEFDRALSSFMESENKGRTLTSDAYVDLSTADFNVVDAVYGDSLDQDKLTKDIYAAIEAGKHSLNYSHDNYIDLPEITKESPQIAKELEYCNQYLKTQITYTFGDKTETLTPEQLNKFIDARDGTIKVDEEAVEAYVHEIALKYDTYFSKRQFKATSGRTVLLNHGTYGYIVDQKAETKQLIKELKEGKDVSREPVYSVKGNGRSGVDDILNTYVEVDLSDQKVYLYKNGKKIVETSCVSGCLKKDKTGVAHGTASGVFAIAYKERDATLRGGNEEDETDYESEVRYWMPFYNGQGLHDADWRDEFGGTIYKKNGSHGCVNLPVHAAGEIFNNVEAGTIVITFY